jgi:hypothetical protein
MIFNSIRPPIIHILLRKIRDFVFNYLEKFLLIIARLFTHKWSNTEKKLIVSVRKGRGTKVSMDDDLFLRTLRSHTEFTCTFKQYNKPLWILDSFQLILFSIIYKRLVIVLIQYVPQFHKFPSMKLIEHLQVRESKIVKIWYDSSNKDLWQKRILKMSDFGVNNFIVDTPKLISKYGSSKNRYFYSPVPIESSRTVPFKDRTNFLYYSGGISNTGSYGQRKEVIDYLRNNSIDVFGMQYDRNDYGLRPTYDQYREALSHSFCGLNFTWKDEAHITTARTWEILSSGVLLLQNKSDVLQGTFVPGIHFLEFTTKEELLQIVQNLQSNTKLIESIALAGKHKFDELYKSTHFWPRVFT